MKTENETGKTKYIVESRQLRILKKFNCLEEAGDYFIKNHAILIDLKKCRSTFEESNGQLGSINYHCTFTDVMDIKVYQGK